MPETDLRSLLMDYANRNDSAYIECGAFIKELSAQALYKSQRNRQWEIWTERPKDRFNGELKLLIKSGVCSIQKRTGAEYVYMPSFFVERVRSAWLNIENQDKEIFPNDKKIRHIPPPELLKTVSVDNFIELLENPQKEDLPIIQLSFSGKLGKTYLLGSFTEVRLLDAAISKIRRCLLNKDNKSFCLKRIGSLFPDRIIQTNTIIDTITKNPISCIRLMRDGDEKTFMIWKKLGEFIKESAHSGSEPLTDTDIAIQQGAEIINVYSSFFMETSIAQNEKSVFLSEIYEKISEEPHFWTFTEIYNIQGKNNSPITESISHEEIRDYILKKTYDNGDDFLLPPFLVFYNEYKEKCLVKKELLFSAFGHLIISSRKNIIEAVEQRWRTILKMYRIEPAMKNDAAFETLLIKIIKRIKPFVLVLHQDTRLPLLKKEMHADSAVNSDIGKYFHGCELRTFSALYELERRSILKNVKISLPFWYSITLFVAILRILKGKSRSDENDETEDDLED
ncbi:MAG: hypothetical protein LBD07_05970 [Spirochaetaceae bacterium]|jgi:hypothetical protein|nr:hypothetical protein [Spirochaetaceae bacterium]